MLRPLLSSQAMETFFFLIYHTSDFLIAIHYGSVNSSYQVL